MIAWLLKNWKLFLDIILVVGGIVLFTIFDPFGMFSKRSLKSTANILSSVKSIGELVTAEYYGEVISSLHGTMVYDVVADTLQNKFESCLEEIKAEIEEIYLDKLEENTSLKSRIRKKLPAEIAKELAHIKTKYKQPTNIYNHLIVFIACREFNKEETAFYKLKTGDLKNNVETDVIEVLLNECIANINQQETSLQANDSINNISYKFTKPEYFDEASAFHYSLNKSQIQKTKKRKQDIVFIGRGWVKAGFRFDQLNKSNFYYDVQNKIIRFYGLSPVVLDKDINPWFIPEKKIKGFELVDFYKNATFEEAKAVKIKCKEELLKQAHTANILQQAQDNGQESLQGFFALLTNEPKLRVEFRDLPYQKEINMIAADTLITANEALLIKAIINTEQQRINNAISPDREYYQEQLGIFTGQLQKLHFVKKGIPFNLFMLEAAETLSRKNFVTPDDSAIICEIRDSIILYKNENDSLLTTKYILEKSIQKSRYPLFAIEFNTMLNLLESEIIESEANRPDTLLVPIKKINELNLNNTYFDFDTIANIDSDSLGYIKVWHKQNKRTFAFTDFKYPELNIPVDSLQNISFINIDEVDSLILRHNNPTSFHSGNACYDTIRTHELALIKSYQSEKIKEEIKLRGQKKFTASIRKFFGKN